MGTTTFTPGARRHRPDTVRERRDKAPTARCAPAGASIAGPKADAGSRCPSTPRGPVDYPLCHWEGLGPERSPSPGSQGGLSRRRRAESTSRPGAPSSANRAALRTIVLSISAVVATTPAGDPVPGATICVKAQTLGTGEPPAPVAAVKTDAEGHFAYAVPAGPDREVMLGYRHDAFQFARDIRYYAHVVPSLEVDPPKLRNGRRVRLWGRLPQPDAARRVVILQANVVGSKRWITFRRATTDDQGDFESGYEFHSTTRRTH